MFSTFKSIAVGGVLVAAVSFGSLAHAQGIYISPGGVGVDPGVRLDDGYHRRRDHRFDEDYGRRDHRRDDRYDRPRYREGSRDEERMRRHRRHMEEDSDQ